MVAKIFIGLAVLWMANAVYRWFDADSSTLSRWMFTGLAVVGVGVAVLHWWRFLRRPPS